MFLTQKAIAFTLAPVTGDLQLKVGLLKLLIAIRKNAILL